MAKPERAALRTQASRIRELQRQQRKHSVALGTLMAHQIAGTARTCNDAEFSVFSQYGEDGIVEYLVRRCEITPSTFVEIGVETYAEANTRFLAEHRLWSGLIIDRNPKLERDLARTGLNWRAQVRAVSAFVTIDNVRELVEPFVESDGLGLLSVDVDGVDYWLLDQLVGLAPAMVVVEYNSLFGDEATVSVPYEPGFDRRRPDYHNIYYGESRQRSTTGSEPPATRSSHAARPATTPSSCAPTVSVRYRARPPRRVPTTSIRGAPLVEGALTGISDPHRQLEDIRHLP